MIRFDDRSHTLSLSVRDLAEEGGVSGHLLAVSTISRQHRLAAGRAAHTAYQASRMEDDDAFRAEVTLRHQTVVGDWTVELTGRVDGLTTEAGRTVVEEVKSTALGHDRMSRTRPDDWPGYVAQLEVYLWMLHEAAYPDPVGRLVLVSLADGSRHVLGVLLDADRLRRFVRRQLERLVALHEDRVAWLARRRTRAVPSPHPTWRRGQPEISDAVTRAATDDTLDAVLVEAPTGLGKTDAVLFGALRAALATDRQILWATSRTTQQSVVEAAVARLVAKGLPLRAVTLTARDKACLNDVVSCRPDACRFAHGHHDKVHEQDVWRRAVDGPSPPARFRELGQRYECCPYQLAVDATERVDVVIADVNYVFDPGARLRRHFDDEEDARQWIVVVDEAHQLVDRARGYLSPRVQVAAARRALRWLKKKGARYGPFAELARDVVELVLDESAASEGPGRGGDALCTPSTRTWRNLADRIEELSVDYAILRATEGGPAAVRGGALSGDGLLPLAVAEPAPEPDDEPAAEEGPERPSDPWRELAGDVIRLATVLDGGLEGLIGIARTVPGEESVGLVCLDPSDYLRPRIARLGALVAASATLSPPSFYIDLLGLDPERTTRVAVGSPFPPANRRVIVAPRISTAFKDRVAHAGRTAELIAGVIEATPGNTAVYFPSFAMLTDIARRWKLPGRELLLQERSMPEELRRAWLARLGADGPPVVLAAVLGGIFAEGIDLPAGALSAVVVAGPALPPVGLERDLQRGYYEDRYGQGFRYASLVPGMTRVVQAAGRLLRRPTDRGVVVLAGRRFRHRDYASLLPDDWQVEVSDDPTDAVAAFWAEEAGGRPGAVEGS